ncbi:beta strand repeat-containing protein [Methanimicrococcus blatticola]|nr:GLUG motif-containing protein [Methanimicrococcus blatticola]MBZ3936434.1 hypothetical protein [Methanimicrococcus blatticola]MCC2509487.1 hypothetical protein [Methanimicrococcus blatticola]
MKKTIKYTILLVIFILTFLSLTGTASAALTGTGASDDPYLIQSEADLIEFRNHYANNGTRASQYYKIDKIGNTDTDPITISLTSDWTPIADFKGNLNGNNSTILNMNVQAPAGEHIGFFKDVSDTATITNLRFENATVNGFKHVGVLAGYSNNATLNNIEIRGFELEGENAIGGIVGDGSVNATDIRIRGYKNGTPSKITGENSVGGVIGWTRSYVYLETVTVDNLDITGIEITGGVVGHSVSGLYVQDVLVNNTKVSGQTYTGGVVGVGFVSGNEDTDKTRIGKQTTDAKNVVVKNSEISGETGVGGIIGCLQEVGEIKSTSVENLKVTGSESVGGIIGFTFNPNLNVSNLIGPSVVIGGNQNLGKPSVTVNGKNYVGGMIGKAESNRTSKIEIDNPIVQNVSVTGIYTEKEDGNNTGGLIGGSTGINNFNVLAGEFYDIYIKGNSNIGGLVGYLVLDDVGNGKTFTTRENNAALYIKNITIEADTFTGGVVGKYIYVSNDNDRIAVENAKIENLNVVTVGSYVGGVFGIATNTNDKETGVGKSTITKVTVNDSILNGGNGDVSGIVGAGDYVVIDLVFVNNSTLTGVTGVGGIAGRFNNSSISEAVVTDSNISGNYTFGGIIGFGKDSNIDHTSFEDGYIKTRGDPSTNIGGLVGQMENSEVVNSIAKYKLENNFVSITTRLGGAVGNLEVDSKIDNVTVILESNLAGNNSIGGIAGNQQYNSVINNSTFEFNGEYSIIGCNSVGGIAGASRGTIFNVTNSGNISASNGSGLYNGNVGGIVGYGWGDLTISQSKSYGNISSTTDNVGGIVGKITSGKVNESSVKNISIAGSNNTGGLIGNVETGAVYSVEQNEVNNVSVTGNENTAGGVGLVNGTINRMNLTNTVLEKIDVDGDNNTGGLVGFWNITDTTETNESSIHDISLNDSNITGLNNTGGLIGYQSKMKLYDLTVENTKIDGKNDTGGLIGTADRTKIEAVYINGLILDSSTERVGGIVGNMEASELKDSRINNSTIGGKQHTGGAVGIAKYLEGYENKIENLTVYNTSITGTIFCGGLTGEAFSQEINNSRVIDSTVTGTQYTGGLVGRQSSGNITVSSVLDTTGNNVVKGEMHVGGFVGQIEGNVSNCSAQINVSNTTGNGNYTGGFAGTLNKEVKNSFSTGNVKAQAGEVGGFSGRQSGTSENCYSTGNVDGGMFGGSFTGNLTSGNITNCYSTGNVTSTVAGGLAGTAVTGSKITNAMALGAYVNGTTADKLIGSGSSTITDTFVWNGMKKANGEITNTKGVPAVKSYNVWDTYGTPKISSGLKKSEWDETWSSTVWKNNDLDSGYKYLLPVFTWQTTASDAPNADASHILYMTDIKIKVMEAV